MSFDAEAKGKIVSEFRRSESDTGSPEVQVALLTGADSTPDGTFQEPTKVIITRGAVCCAW